MEPAKMNVYIVKSVKPKSLSHRVEAENSFKARQAVALSTGQNIDDLYAQRSQLD